MQKNTTRLNVISNRLPVVISRTEDGWDVEPGTGGLVTAIAPVLRNRGGAWIGWSGSGGYPPPRHLFREISATAGYDLIPVRLEKSEVEGYYKKFSNEIIWPLFHDLPSHCHFDPSAWDFYLNVNNKFAEAVMAHASAEDFLWVHDYHFFHLAQMLKKQGARNKIGFFLHIPFPPPDNFLKLPWRSEIVRALLAYDLVGFQTYRDRRNFERCARMLVPDVDILGRGNLVRAVRPEGETRLGVFPISIDFNEFVREAVLPETAARSREIRGSFGNRKLILGVDRLDYTKGIPLRLKAIGHAFTRYPELIGRAVFLQILVPSRGTVRDYQDLKMEIDRLVGEINGQFSTPDWTPVHYQYRSLSRSELVAYYRAADIMLVTPLRDGMNLVCKEYCACNVDECGSLILSEFAGAACQLQRVGVTLVNPYDADDIARRIHAACARREEERRAAMRRARESIRRNDIYEWVNDFLSSAFSRYLMDFPIVDRVVFHNHREEALPDAEEPAEKGQG